MSEVNGNMRIAICDDDKECLQKYHKIFKSTFENLGISVEILLFASCKKLIFALGDEAEELDVVFLDINMPDMNGIEMAHWIREKQYRCEIIFLTVSQSHMLQAFDVGAFHYIIKDITTPEKIESICRKVAAVVNTRKREVITVSCAGENRAIPVLEILYFEVQNYIIVVHYAKESFEFYSTMGKIENSLSGHGFVRVHRSYLVNIRHIQSVVRQEMTLTNGQIIPIGRKYLEDIRQLLQSRNETVVSN